jgi:hypothetical protein
MTLQHQWNVAAAERGDTNRQVLELPWSQRDRRHGAEVEITGHIAAANNEMPHLPRKAGVGFRNFQVTRCVIAVREDEMQR